MIDELTQKRRRDDVVNHLNPLLYYLAYNTMPPTLDELLAKYGDDVLKEIEAVRAEPRVMVDISKGFER